MDRRPSIVVVETIYGSRLSKRLVSLANDVIEFNLTVEMAGLNSFGDYSCSISNGVGNPLILTYTIQLECMYQESISTE